MQQEKNKTKASPAAAGEVCHFSSQFPALWEQPPKGLWRESGSRQKHTLSGALCAGNNPSFPTYSDVTWPQEPLVSGSLLDHASWLLW